MYHSIIFGEKNTWDDWHLIPSSRPVFATPSVRTNYVEVPGADGALDLTEALVNRPLYNNREGNFEFIVYNDIGTYADDKTWSEIYSEIAAYIHGKKMNSILEDDPGYYYHGRFFLDEWKSDPNYSTISISYVVDPYKYEKTQSYDPYSKPANPGGIL